jgi:hypothetical protein
MTPGAAHRARLLIWLLTSLLVGGLLAIPLAERAPAGSERAHAAAAPDALMHDLAALDVKLATLIRGERDKHLDYAALKSGLEAAHASTRELTKHFSADEVPKFYGQDLGKVMSRLECVDAKLSLSYGALTEESEHHFKSFVVQAQSFLRLLDAFECGEQLWNALRQAKGDPGGPPQGLIDDMSQVTGAPASVMWKMAEYVGDKKTLALRQTDPQAAEERIKERAFEYVKKVQVHDVKTAWFDAHARKQTMVLTYFTQSVFGVPAADSILAIDCIGSDLSFAEGINEAAHGHYFTSGVRDQLVNQLEHAKKCKESLETKLRNQVTVTQTTTVGPPIITGGP